jgi:hypothetical protein
MRLVRKGFATAIAAVAPLGIAMTAAANAPTLVLDPASPSSDAVGTTLTFDYNWTTSPGTCAFGTSNSLVLRWDDEYPMGTAPVSSDASGCHGVVSGKVPADQYAGGHTAQAYVQSTIDGQTGIISGSFAYRQFGGLVVTKPSPVPLRHTPRPTRRPAAAPSPSSVSSPSPTVSLDPMPPLSTSPSPGRLIRPVSARAESRGFPAWTAIAALGLVGAPTCAGILVLRSRRRRSPGERRPPDG